MNPIPVFVQAFDCKLRASFLNTLSGKILSGKYLVTSEKLVTFPRPIFKIKRTFMSGTAFFPEKSYSLSLGFFKLSAEECTVGVTKPFLLLVFKVV